MDAVLTTIKPIVQKLVEDELTTLIKPNIEKIDTLEPMVDAKLKEVAGQIKALIIDNINKIPFVPDSVKQGFISQIPVDKLIELINGFDFEPFKATLLAIPTTGISDPTELNKIKTTLTGLPDKIKILLIKYIESVFNSTEAATSDTAEAATTTDTAAATTTDTAATNVSTATDIAAATNVSTATDTTKTIDAIKAGLAGLNDAEKNKIIDTIMKMLKGTGVLDLIKPQLSSNPPAPPAPAGGGAKQKHRRKTKKNIRRNNNGKTRFGRTF